MSTLTISSAHGILSLLDEQDAELKEYALAQLNLHVEQYWPEIATQLVKIESLYEDDSFQQRPLAAVVASKVFYHLDELDEALKYALGAGPLFDVHLNSQYVHTLISKCIDEYVRQRNAQYNAQHSSSSSASSSSSSLTDAPLANSSTSVASSSSSSSFSSSAVVAVDPRLNEIVERMFTRCFQDHQYHQALGIAIESKRLDQVRTSISQSHDIKALLQYAYQLSQSLVLSHTFKRELLETLVELYEAQDAPDYPSMCQCLLFLNQSQKAATILNTLVSATSSSRDPSSAASDSHLIAYQIAFDLWENEDQSFLNAVSDALPVISQPEPASATDSFSTSPIESASGVSSPSASSSSSAPLPQTLASRLQRLRSILNGTVGTRLHLQFLFEKNATDLNILKHIKDKLEPRNTVTHNAAVIAHSLMHCGTTVDSFLRDNLEWLAKAQNWAKFTATASIGVIHKGHIEESRKLLEPYLPSPGSGGSPYQEGGALFALGLVHQSHGASQVEYLSEALKNAGSNEIVQHGACLGLGLCAAATSNAEVFESLKGVVMSESAVAGEAAGYAMGLIMLGSGNGVAIEEMLAYAHDTTHEKIIRGLALGIAMILYGREEEADLAIEQLMADKDPILRYGAMYAIGLAYACTANSGAVQRLLHVAVSDVSDDVRRAAVTCLGLVLANVPEQVPRVVALLAESYNPHVRHGAALAVGIACAGGATALVRREALGVLEPLLKDRVDFVRQGAFIGMGMVLIQHNTESEPKVALLRKSINDAMAVKSDTMTKFGAILSAGIMDAGGRNVTISLLSSSGHKKQGAIIGLALFPQFWFWYPMVHFVSLAFTPTALIGLNGEFEMPTGFSVLSRAHKKMFEYPAPLDLSKKEEKKEVKHATLSVTAKAQAKQKRRENEEKKEKEDVEMVAVTPSELSVAPEAKTVSTADDKMEVDDQKAETKTEDAVGKSIASKKTVDLDALPFHILSSPARVTLAQRSSLMCPRSQRYSPIANDLSGFVLLKDSKPEEPVVLVKSKTRKFGAFDNEPAPPKPFIYTPTTE